MNAIFSHFKLEVDEATVRLMPGMDGKLPYFTSRTHAIGKTPYPCPRRVREGKWLGDCVICDYYNDFHKNGQPRFYKGAHFENDLMSIKPFERHRWNIIVRGQEESGVLIWSCGMGIHKMILEAIVGSSRPYPFSSKPLGDVTHVQEGYDFNIVRSWIKSAPSGNQYPDYGNSRFSATPSPLGTKEEISRWLNQCPITIMGYEAEIKHFFNDPLVTPIVLKPKEEIIDALEGVFGYLGASRGKKTIYRSIDESFDPTMK